MTGMCQKEMPKETLTHLFKGTYSMFVEAVCYTNIVNNVNIHQKENRESTCHIFKQSQ